MDISIPVRRIDLAAWRKQWIEENGGGEHDCVTPFDRYLFAERGWVNPRDGIDNDEPPAPKLTDAAGYTTGPVNDGGVDPRERVLPQAPPPRIEPGYERLAAVLQAALDQAQRGKGKERHANDRPFHEQRMQTLSDALNSAKGMAFQACKKVTEGVDHPTYEQQERELLGAIVYIGGMIVWLKRHHRSNHGEI